MNTNQPTNASPLNLYNYKAQVLSVKDGDSIIVEIDLGFQIKLKETLRLIGINTPEKTGVEKALGFIAKQKLEEVLFPPDIIITTFKDDSFGRWLAEVYLPNGTHVNKLLVDEGYALAWDGKGECPKFDITKPYPIPKPQ